jgi:hypothetical protein
MNSYLSNYNQTHECPKCHHTNHEITEDLHSFTLFYGEVRRPAFYCTYCPCRQPLALLPWLFWKWTRPKSWRDVPK